MLYKGVVSNISSFDYQGKKLWSFQLNNDRGIFYRTGNIRPRCEQGEFVIFEGSPGKQANSVNVDTKNFTVKPITETEASGVQVAATAARPVILERKAGSDYWEKKEARDVIVQARIERQSTRNSALEFIKILISTEALKFPAKADKVEVLENLLSHYQEAFLKDNSGEKAEPTEAPAESELSNEVPY